MLWSSSNATMKRISIVTRLGTTVTSKRDLRCSPAVIVSLHADHVTPARASKRCFTNYPLGQYGISESCPSLLSVCRRIRPWLVCQALVLLVCLSLRNTQRRSFSITEHVKIVKGTRSTMRLNSRTLAAYVRCQFNAQLEKSADPLRCSFRIDR
jgi:hypothetical protein